MVPMQRQYRRTLSRRRFVQGLVGCGAAGLLGRQWTWGQSADGSGLRVPGAEPFDLTVAPLAVNVTGRPRAATAVNGQVPAPELRCREGDILTVNVTNRLAEPASIHWHGILLRNAWDGVPGLTFGGIAPGATFTYRFPLAQSGTYWYHSHSGMQEQTGLYGALIIAPRAPEARASEAHAFDRDHVVLLADWTDEDPMAILANLKQQSDYYDVGRRTLAAPASLADRLMWARMRMSPTDLVDVSGAVYTYLVNGRSPAANWTGLFNPGERVRLRFINAASMTNFDVRIPGLTMRVVQADGSDIEPVAVDEFRIGTAETYDVIVTPGNTAYTLFAQAQDRSGYARATLAPRLGMTAPVPALDARAERTMRDLGPGMGMGVTMTPSSRLAEAGIGLDGDGRRALTYADLRSLRPTTPAEFSGREIEFHLTGNMERWVWGFDGKKFSETGPVHVALGERIRFVLINDTMMEHPIHLHGFLTALENGQGANLPLKHTVIVKPAERLSYLFTADQPGRWAFHCHLLYHMDTGMFRTILVA
jgi:CopA family copper-resistance protein